MRSSFLPTTGKVSAAQLTALSMGQSANAIKVDRLDIQRAQSAVLVEKDGVQYAIVSDDNYHFLDPYWKAMYEVPMFIQTSPYRPPTAVGGSASAKKVAVGGKLGIVKDPFGKLGTPQYLGATLPLDGYGIVNLSLSEDGQVLIGQLKGGFSANIFDMAQKPHQNLAWNVNTLLDAALALPEKDRQSKHIALAASAAQLIPVPTTADGYVMAPAGTAFDPADVKVSYEGRMGDVLDVDLKNLIADWAARTLLGWKNATEFPESAMAGDERRILRDTRARWLQDGKGADQFYLQLGQISTLTQTNPGGLKLVTQSVKEGNRVYDKALSRNADLTEAQFKDTGRMFFVPNITPENETTLRNGGTIETPKIETVNFGFRFKNAQGVWEWKDGTVKVTAKDFATTTTTFFGDRPLDNPGYSELKLAGEVSVAAQQAKTIDTLDVYKIEQRLKYLGFPAYDTGTGNTIKDFSVDGIFSATETAALKLFEKVVRYQESGPAARIGLASIGADGVTEQVSQQIQSAPTRANVNSSQGLQTINWLNSYNAPHWMELFGTGVGGNGLPNNAQLPGWRSTQTGAVNSDQVERYGVSWMRDLMVAKSLYAPISLSTGYESRFNGITDANAVRTPRMHSSHDLGMALDLGIGNYLNARSQGRRTEAVIPAVTTTALTDAQRANQWSDVNAAQLAQLMYQRNLVERPLSQAQQLQLQQAVQNRTFIDPTSNPAWAGDNDQRAALMDFAAMYSLTQDAGGSWRNIQLQNTDNAQDDIRKGLFGGGDAATGLISKVLVGDAATPTQPLDNNPLTNIRNALARLGVNYGAANAHQNHFHIYLRPPAPVRIGGGTANLLANEAASAGTSASDTPFTTESIQDWLDDAAADGIELLEDFTMFAFDAPEAHLPPQTVLIAQAVTSTGQTTPKGRYVDIAQPDAHAASVKPDMTLVSCQSPGYNTLSPEIAVENYFYKKFKHQLDTDNAKVELIETTKKAALSYFRADDGRSRGWLYNGSTEVKEGVSTKPNGVDQAIFLVNVKNLSTGKMMNIRLIDRIGLTGVRPKDADDNTTIDCGPIRRISATDSMHDLAAWQRASDHSTLLAIASQTLTSFADLPGSAVGNTVGEGPTAQITLDPTAAGHGWYIDPTPLDNTDAYLPTSNPNIWQAKAGSAAEEKMDMLSVLLHEYGHALGLEHSADARDFMATTLQPGERRLPSSEELALMSRLVAQLKAQSTATDASASNTPGAPGSPSAPTAPLPGMPFASLGLLALGRLRSDRSGTQTLFATSAQPAGSALFSAASTAPTAQYAVAANATLTNGQFNTANSWSTQGSVSMASGAATLAESATQQTRLNQVFTVGPQDRYLSFTLSGTALDSATAGAQAQQGPSDAFEVALLNANTGASVAGATGLTHTDALLNLQAGGAELAASGVSYVSNQDGSRTCSGCKPSGHGTVVTVGPLYGTPTASAKWPVSDYHAKPSHSRRPIANGA